MYSTVTHVTDAIGFDLLCHSNMMSCKRSVLAKSNVCECGQKHNMNHAVNARHITPTRHKMHATDKEGLERQRHVWFIPLADVRGVCR